MRFASDEIVVFAGRERGEFVVENRRVPLTIRTSRVFSYRPEVGWRQIHHHGSIDDPRLLQAYQDAVTATTPHQSVRA